MRPLHTPYAGRHRPFSIAMAPLEEDVWLEVDDHRAADLAQKAEIFASADDAFLAELDTEAAQAEALALVEEHLARRRLLAGVPAPAADAPPLMRAAMLVQDDLTLMRRGEDGWRLAVSAVCFPTAWSPAEKFGRPMDAIHTNVPGWAGPMGTRVSRIFDQLKPGALVWRLNWSLQFGDAMRRSLSKHTAPRPDGPMEALMVRVERQTLRKMPGSGDILFTVKILLDPIAAIARHPEAARLAAGLSDQLAGLSDAEVAYKGLTATRASILARLSEIGAQASAV
ncbi:heme-dependent oxidative N-demethylase family protein [Acuticoccus mangrovi]|uniref:DUF3445 domain-containing protein n=1 Tax=Acuticoccus mangrovi TaxID=2796142 RepID=A0A934ISG3_9HYPH|nr:DUF3445 domain-containing protein [Acuticoccus mangrovi]MBJ3776829.1 DUF3445 domain-containing protein [Acuticoccus mangrovi]